MLRPGDIVTIIIAVLFAIIVPSYYTYAICYQRGLRHGTQWAENGLSADVVDDDASQHTGR